MSVVTILDNISRRSRLFAVNKLGAIAVPTMSIDELRFENTIPLDIELTPTDICMLVYTGGTTGPSKGCMNSRRYLCGLARQAQIMRGRDPKTINWTPLPMFHQNASVTSVLCLRNIGARVMTYPRFSASNFGPEVERTGANDVAARH